MAKCLFSVVIPLYNMADTIKRTIDTVLHQNCQDFEIVVVDDGSKDDGASVAGAIDDNRITIIRQPNGGVSAARNKGIEHTKGQFVTFLDADDEYAPEHLETIKHLIDTYPDYNVYATSYAWARDGEKILPSIKGLHFTNSQKAGEGVLDSFFRTASRRHGPVHIGSIAVRRTILMGGEKIRFPVGIVSGEDQYFIARLMINNKMVYSLKPTCIYNVKTVCRPKKTHEKQDECFDSFLKLDCKDKYLRRYVALWHTRRAVGGFRTKDPKTCFYHLWRSIQIRPFQTKIFTAMLSAFIRR